MGRTTPANNANATYGSQSQTANDAAQKNIGQYNANETKLASGMDVGADPFKSTGYLSNVNKLQSEALNTGADSAKSELRRGTIATGGINGSQSILGQRDIGLQTGRLADTLSSARAANDYKANLGWQAQLAQAPLAGASAESGLYSTATGGQGNALNNLTNLSGQQYGFYGGMINSALSGAGTGAGLAAGCWLAAAVFDEDFYTGIKTNLVRNWLWEKWIQNWYAKPILALYQKFGKQAAKVPWIVRLFTPLFNAAYRKAVSRG